MDPIKILKFQAIHKYKKHHQPSNNLYFYSLTALITCSLFCFCPLWLPALTSSMKVFVPKISSVFLSSKFVFILGNLIVVALVGESKIFSTVSSSPASIVDHYESMKRCQTLQSSSACQQMEPENFNSFVEERVLLKSTCGDLDDVVEKGLDEESEEIVEKVKEDDLDEEEDELDLPEDDQQLSQRADDFIARVNERRMFELKLDNCFCNGE